MSRCQASGGQALPESMSAQPSTPTMGQRIAMQQRPFSLVVGRQLWSDLLFLHWRVSADAVQATLPSGLFADTFEGDAYIGIVPFLMERVRPAWLPPLPWISWFLELNVRTYVHDGNGQPGVWFYSLDCNQPVAVAIAQSFFHLPYLHARMRATRSDRTIRYRCQRRGQDGEPWCYEWSPGTHAAPAAPGTLEFHLIERYVLYSVDRENRLHQGRVHHTPYRIHTPVVSSLSTGPARLAGFDLVGDPVSVLGAKSVYVSIFPLRPVLPTVLTSDH